MAKIKALKKGKVGLIQELEDGRIVQLGLSLEQSELLQNYLVIISQDDPLVQLGEHYDLKLKKD